MIRSSRRTAALVLAPFVAIALVGCSSDSGVDAVRSDDADTDATVESVPTPTEPVDVPATDVPDDPAGPIAGSPCDLLTGDEIATLVGRSFDEGVADDGLLGVSCRWTVADEPPTPQHSTELTFTVRVDVADEFLLQQVDEALAEPDSYVIDDLGDRAVVENRVIAGPILVVVDDLVVQVDTSNFGMPPDFEDDDQLAEILTEAARLILPRL